MNFHWDKDRDVTCFYVGKSQLKIIQSNFLKTEGALERKCELVY